MRHALTDSRLAAMIVVIICCLGGVFANAGETPAPPRNTPAMVRRYWLTPAPAGDDVVQRGEWLFRQKGCFLCHGPAGRGGVPNRNYVNDTVPRLSPAKLMRLEEPEHIVAVLEHLKRRLPLDAFPEQEEIPRFNVVIAQYQAIHDLIEKGRTPDKKDGKGPAPPLAMPSWKRELSPGDIDAILTYLIDTRYREESPQGESAQLNH